MTPERHAKIQAIFEAVIDLPVSQRQRYLDEMCLADADLRARVERLLKATDEQETLSGDPGQHAAFVKECPTCSRCFEGSTQTCSQDGTRLEPRFQGRLLIHGKYLIERTLGHGGMGAVYMVKHLGLDKKFALKLIRSNGAIPKHFRESFETEARALGRLKHPNIVDVTDYGVDPNGGGQPYLVMEYLDGQTLREVLKGRHTLPLPEALDIFRVAAAALDFAHQQNIVHGDWKPSNLFLARQAESTVQVKVVDFGLARLMPPPDQDTRPEPIIKPVARKHVELHAQIRGTVPYMAPELFQGQAASASSDRFAFGAAVYETLTGALPYGEHLSTILENFSRPPKAPSAHNPKLPKELDQPILALLSPHASDRPATASSAVQALEEAWLLAQQREWRTEESPRRLVLAIVATLLVLLFAGFAAKLRISQVLEGRVWDARLATLPKHSPDPRLLVVTVDDATITADTRPLADTAWADEFGRNLDRMLTSGARGVAVDLLLPSAWSQSTEFARAIGRSADRLVLALFSAPSGSVIGAECVGPLVANVLGSERYRTLFGFVNLQEDEDRIIRRARAAYADRSGGDRASLAGRLAAISDRIRHVPTESPIWIDYSVRLDDIPKISWKDLTGRLDAAPDLVRDKLVIVGADYEGSGDVTRVPQFVSSNLVPGVLVQALIVNTIVAGLTFRSFGLAACLAVAGVFCFLIFALALRFPHRFGWLSLGTAFALCFYVLFAFAISHLFHAMVTVVAPFFAILVSLLVAWGLKSYLRPYPMPKRVIASAPGPLGWLRRKAVYAAALLMLIPMQAADCCKGSIAVIASLSGQASVRDGATQKHAAVSSLDWLLPGATLELAAASNATVILLNGRRYELGAGARVTVTADGLTGASGPVNELERLPPIPKATPIADRTARTSGAVRVRGDAAPIRLMYPRDGMAALADRLNLSFAAIPEATIYRIELMEADGSPLDSIQTAATHVEIPAGTVQAGAMYSWHVSAMGRLGVVGEGQATFETISDQDARERAALTEALSRSPKDATVLALLADVDRRLGLLEEARQGWNAALSLRPGDSAILHALEDLKATLADDK